MGQTARFPIFRAVIKGDLGGEKKGVIWREKRNRACTKKGRKLTQSF